MLKYQWVIDKLIPESFIVSKSYTNKIILKAINSKHGAGQENVNLKIEFSDNEIFIGNFSLLELKTK